jgi:hypothetical protein
MRFEVFSARQPYLLGLAIQADGQVAVYVPFGGERSHRITPGSKYLVEGSVELDRTSTDELLVMILSSAPVTAEVARQAAQRAFREAGGRLRSIGQLNLPGEQLLRLLPRQTGSP